MSNNNLFIKNNLHVQYGCGLYAPGSWVNFDASPSLRIQKLPLIGRFSKKFGLPVFPSNVHYGDIVKGLPVAKESCEAVYCSHILEHLAYEDALKALRNTLGILRSGGLFRIVVPDLNAAARTYVDSTEETASIKFMESTFLGYRSLPRGLASLVRRNFGNSNHLWMWDFKGLAAQLREAGFKEVRRAQFGDSSLSCYREVENIERWDDGVGIECMK